MDESVYPGFVSKYYIMDPKTEDVLVDSSLLANDMVVLIEDPDFRAPINPGLPWKSPEEQRTALINNRWSIVSHLTFLGEQVFFVSVYPDGTKIRRSEHLTRSWIVKKNTLPDEMVGESKIHQLMAGAEKARHGVPYDDKFQKHLKKIRDEDVDLEDKPAVENTNPWGKKVTEF